MEPQFDLEKLFEKGEIESELELERALTVDRSLRIMGKKDAVLNQKRQKLRDLIAAYEEKNWSADSEITNLQISESDLASITAEKERIFIKTRREKIRSKLKTYGLKQQQLGILLGHKNKSYISELMNGIRPFTLKDLIIIHKLFKIDLSELIPTTLSTEDRKQLKDSIAELDNQKLQLENLELV